MSEVKWTPGHWTYEPEDYAPEYVRGPAGQLIAHVIGDSAGTQANAYLIAAAPDLYEALQELLHIYTSEAIPFPHEEELALDLARAALARAKGATP
jgi:hypothetical protein